jgi:uncharacterized membrane protein
MKVAFQRHARFYAALGCGLIAYGITAALRLVPPLLVAGDVFYLVFLGLCLSMIAGQSAADLRLRAKNQDEGIAIVLLITLATMGYFCLAAFTALHERHGGPTPLILAGTGALMGWFVLHMVMAFHYADIHYFDDPDCAGDEKDLLFPGGGDPGPWDFLYYSFVVGMTAQVSDVQVTTTVMRRATLLHGIVSFFFNTVLIAMAVNAAVAMAG